jgi:hypothetical protein
MKMKIDQIADFGKETERVELTVLEDCNLMYFLVSDSAYRHEKYISNTVLQTHWFPPCEVKQNDKITLYTKKGQESILKVGHTTVYTFYRGLENCVWEGRDAAVLFELSGWRTINKATVPPPPRKNWFKTIFAKSNGKKRKSAPAPVPAAPAAPTAPAAG